MFIAQLPPINLLANEDTMRITLNNTIQYRHPEQGIRPGDILLQRVFLADTVTPTDSFINDTIYNRTILEYCTPVLSRVDMADRQSEVTQSAENPNWKVLPVNYDFSTSLAAFKAARGNNNDCVIIVESMIFNPNYPQCPAVPSTLEEWQTYKANAQYSYFTVTYFRGVIT